MSELRMRSTDALLEQHRVDDPPEEFRDYATVEDQRVCNAAGVLEEIRSLAATRHEE